MWWLVVVLGACSGAPAPVANRVAPEPPPSKPEPATCVDLAVMAPAAVGDDRMEGSLDKNGIKHVIHAHAGELRACYERYRQHGDGEGRVDVTFTIGAGGRVVRADVTGFDPALDLCVCEVVGRCRFPAFHGPVVVTYPFDFQIVAPP
jgi:hypothetical protein